MDYTDAWNKAKELIDEEALAKNEQDRRDRVAAFLMKIHEDGHVDGTDEGRASRSEEDYDDGEASGFSSGCDKAMAAVRAVFDDEEIAMPKLVKKIERRIDAAKVK